MSDYIDIDLSLKPSPNKDFKTLTDEVSIKNSIARLLSMELHDIPFDDRIQSFLKELLFESSGQLSVAMVETNLRWLLDQYEPRIKVNEIITEFDDTNQGISITIRYLIIKTNATDEYVYSKSKGDIQS